MLSKEAVQEYKKIYERKFNEKISDEVALEMATNLINLFKIISRPIKENVNKNGEHYEKSMVLQQIQGADGILGLSQSIRGNRL